MIRALNRAGDAPVTTGAFSFVMTIPDLPAADPDQPTLAMIVLRVWRDSDHATIHGRLISPQLPHPTTGAGDAQLLGLVERALRELHQSEGSGI